MKRYENGIHFLSQWGVYMVHRYEGTNPLVIAWLAAKVVYEELFPLVAISLLTWLSLLLILPGPPALAALHEVLRRAAEGRAIHVGLWREEWRAAFRTSWKLAGLSLFSGGVLFANVLFYGRLGGGWRYVSVAFIWLLLVWGLTNVYLWAVMAVQDESRVLILFRNALYLVLLYPVHTLVAALLLAVITLLSVLLPILLLLLPAYWAAFTTILVRQFILAVHRRS